MPKTAWKLDGVGGVSTGQPGSPPTEQGSTTGRYTCPQAIQSTIGSTMAANRPARRNLIRIPIKKLLVTTAEELNILTAGPNSRQWRTPDFEHTLGLLCRIRGMHDFGDELDDGAKAEMPLPADAGRVLPRRRPDVGSYVST